MQTPNSCDVSKTNIWMQIIWYTVQKQELSQRLGGWLPKFWFPISQKKKNKYNNKNFPSSKKMLNLHLKISTFVTALGKFLKENLKKNFQKSENL